MAIVVGSSKFRVLTQVADDTDLKCNTEKDKDKKLNHQVKSVMTSFNT